jgi:hypothetical protein
MIYPVRLMNEKERMDFDIQYDATTRLRVRRDRHGWEPGVGAPAPELIQRGEDTALGS